MYVYIELCVQCKNTRSGGVRLNFYIRGARLVCVLFHFSTLYYITSINTYIVSICHISDERVPCTRTEHHDEVFIFITT